MSRPAPDPRRTSQTAPEFDAWRSRARGLLAAGTAPEDVHWNDASQASLFQHDPAHPDGSGIDDDSGRDIAANAGIRIPARLLQLFEACACHRDPARYALMYRLLWRATHGERDLLDDAAD